MEIAQIVILSVTGLFIALIGTLRLSNPIANYSKNSGIRIDKEVNLLNEIRGVSALMLVSGVVIALGALIPSLMQTSFVVGCAIFFGFALGRLISMGVDGKPNKKLTQGMVFELVFGAANLFGLLML